ncbi:hypothetical protein PG990_009961 [Apiospora arundinis]
MASLCFFPFCFYVCRSDSKQSKDVPLTTTAITAQDYKMRLINVQTHELQEFYGSRIPKYAILTHTWGSEEVSHQEWLSWLATGNPSVANKQGFEKIMGACKVANGDELNWLWVDTNCIDKASSAELTEAINSMYAWYRGSTICYGYLADVPTASNDDAAFLSSFRNSRWHRRGWTLQELLAPQSLVFYSQSWTMLGTKYRGLSFTFAASMKPPWYTNGVGILDGLWPGTSTMQQTGVATISSSSQGQSPGCDICRQDLLAKLGNLLVLSPPSPESEDRLYTAFMAIKASEDGKGWYYLFFAATARNSIVHWYCSTTNTQQMPQQLLPKSNVLEYSDEYRTEHDAAYDHMRAEAANEWDGHETQTRCQSGFDVTIGDDLDIYPYMRVRAVGLEFTPRNRPWEPSLSVPRWSTIASRREVED